jgi:8-oxo-dGTP diphosphatase
MIDEFDSPPNAASVALIRDRRVLLIQRGREPWLGAWSLPGGRREADETAEDCARREIREEVGIIGHELLPVGGLLLADGKFRLQVFATTRFEGEVVPNDEIADYRWIALGDEAGLKTTPHLPEVLERAFRLIDAS